MRKRNLLMSLCLLLALTVTPAAHFAVAESQPTDTLYVEDFSTLTEYGGFAIADGAIKSTGNYTIANLPTIAYTADWQYSMDLTFPAVDVSDTAFVGISIQGIDAANAGGFTEFGVRREKPVLDENGVRTNSDAVYTNTGVNKTGFNIVGGQAITLKVVKTGNAVAIYLGDVLAETLTFETTGTITHSILFTNGAADVLVDNITYKKVEDVVVPETPVAPEGSIYYEPFAKGETEFGGFAVVDGAIKSTGNYTIANLPPIAYTYDWQYSMDLIFPVTELSDPAFVGISIQGIDAANVGQFTEFAVRRELPVYGDNGERTNSDVVYTNTGIEKAGFNIISGEVVTLKVVKTGNEVAIYLNDVLAETLTYAATEKITHSILFTSGAADVLIDNITFIGSDAVAPEKPAIESIEISGMEEAEINENVIISAVINPVNAADPETVEWKVNGIVQENQTGKSFVFIGKEAGTYTVTCTMDGIVSNEISITVKEAEEITVEFTEELYNENFDDYSNGEMFGYLKVKDGAIMPESDGHMVAYLPNMAFGDDWEFTMDVTFPTVEEYINMFAGIAVRGLVYGKSEEYTEFALKKRCPELDENGNRINSDSVYSKENVTEFYGVSLGDSVKINFRVVKIGNKVSVYVDGEKTLTVSYRKTAKISQIMLFTYAATNTQLDNVTVKVPPIPEDQKPDITGVNLTVSAIETEVNKKVSLRANAIPYDAVTPTSIKWFMNGKLIEGQTATSYEFNPTEAGEYVFTCELNGVMSNEKKITVKAAPEPEKPEEPDFFTKLSGCSSTVNSPIIFGVIAISAGAMIGSKKRRDD